MRMSDPTSFSIGRQILKYFNDFYYWHIQFHGKIEQKQVKIKKIKWNMFKSDSFFLIYKVLEYLNEF